MKIRLLIHHKIIIIFICILSAILLGYSASNNFYPFYSETAVKAVPHGGCNTCHLTHNSLGSQITMVNGNANLCMSCHNPAGTASALPFADIMKAIPGISGNSHSWNTPAVNFTYGANTPTDAEMLLRVYNDTIVCSTCHNQHSQEFTPFLRADNTGDAMCKDCHSVRNVGIYTDNPSVNKGSHPVGVKYDSLDTRFKPSPLVPITLVGSTSDSVECSSCHQIHYATTSDGNLLRTINDDSLCQSCHTYTGHMTLGCNTCHQAHNPNLTNIFLIKDTINTPNSGNKAVIFSGTTGANSYADGNSNYNGVCEVCHTTTAYHQNNASGNHSHNTGVDCIACHPHEDEFQAGDCITCHTVAQDNGDGVPIGGRRAIIGEFPSSIHAHYGAVLDADDCRICHFTDNHQAGNVELIDMDNGSVYSFLKPDSLHSDPDVSDFCQSCHDSDGATLLASPFDPFGNGNAAPDIATRFLGTLQWNEWYGDFCFGNEGTLRGVNSHHDISDADQSFSGAKLECLNCHGSHISSAAAPIADPDNPTSVWLGSDNAFCLTCHDGGIDTTSPGFPPNVVGPTIPLRGLESCNYGAPPWYVDYTWSHTPHGTDSKRAWTGYSGAPQYELLCKDCHDPHGSYTPSNTLGNPYMIRDSVYGSSYVDDGIRPGAQWTGPPWNTFGADRAVKVTISGVDVDWGSSESLCSVCHANWLNAYSWHSSCNGCQTCHGHGQAFGNNDWGGGSNSVSCAKNAASKIIEILEFDNPTKLHYNSK